METPCFYPYPCELTLPCSCILITLPLPSMPPCHYDTSRHLLAQLWSEWVVTELAGKPMGISAASWLRVRCLIHSTKGA